MQQKLSSKERRKLAHAKRHAFGVMKVKRALAENERDRKKEGRGAGRAAG
jgi:hypothetical protein